MAFEFDRAHYRIEYPLAARPRFIAERGTEWPVDNCSERGFRYQTDEPAGSTKLPRVGTPVAGRIEFCTGATALVTGHVVRVTKGDVAVQLEESSIPLSVIWAEQRYLRANFPERFFGPPI